MKTVYLLRHAKSALGDQNTDDHERILNARGRKAAPGMGRWILAQGYKPDLILCSTALRARETVELAFSAVPSETIRFETGLYLATAGALFHRLQELEESHTSVLMAGHNPGLADLGLFLARSDGSAAELARYRALASKFPTTGFVGLKLPAQTWRDLAPHTGELFCFVSPKDL